MQTITMNELNERLGKLGKSELILDVREPDEYREAHVPGSRNIPLAEVGQHASELAKFERVYIHCRSGKRAQVAFAELESKGLKNLVCIAGGGMMDWVSAGFKFEQGA